MAASVARPRVMGCTAPCVGFHADGVKLTVLTVNSSKHGERETEVSSAGRRAETSLLAIAVVCKQTGNTFQDFSKHTLTLSCLGRHSSQGQAGLRTGWPAGFLQKEGCCWGRASYCVEDPGQQGTWAGLPVPG